MRQLEKLVHMQKNLQEDFQNVKESLDKTDKVKQRSIANFDSIEKENTDDKKRLEL